MKYLNTGTRNLNPAPPPAEWAALLEAAKEWMNAGFADGRTDCHYVFIEGGGGFTISNAGSHEEAMAALVSYPLYPFFDWEVKPLCDWSDSYDLFIQLWKQQATE
jgi:hypothetical protein